MKSCPQNAKVVIYCKSRALKFIKRNRNVIACLAPSFISSFYPNSYGKVVGALKEIGFSEVWEVAVGAEVLSKESISAKLVDALMCKGCIEGAKINNESNHYEKINDIYEFYNCTTNEKIELDFEIDLSRRFINKRSILPFPSEEEIRKILEMTNKFNKEDELNCGACGYRTCRDKAVAVSQEIAELDMCLPYLLSKKRLIYNQLLENPMKTL